MACWGFKKRRKLLKYRCPACAYGYECRGRKECERGHLVDACGRVLRIPLAKHRRVFTPIPRHSYKWAKANNRRSAVERVFSRVDSVFGFENDTIRGIGKIEMRVGMTLLVNVCMALGRAECGEMERMGSLVLPLKKGAW
jgi:hypothetical protein